MSATSDEEPQAERTLRLSAQCTPALSLRQLGRREGDKSMRKICPLTTPAQRSHLGADCGLAPGIASNRAVAELRRAGVTGHGGASRSGTADYS